MRKLGWLGCGVGYALLSSLLVAVRSVPWPLRRRRVRSEEIESGVLLLLGLGELAGTTRSFQDYLRKAIPANGLVHIAMSSGLALTFARLKGLRDRPAREAAELVLVHDLFEPVRPEGDKPHYDRSKLPEDFDERIKVLRKKRPPSKEESATSRRERYRKYLPFMEELTASWEPSVRNWVLRRFAQFYLDETPQAKLARMCDRLSDAFLGPWYVKQNEDVDDFLRWARIRARSSDPFWQIVIGFLESHYTPEGETEEGAIT